jgi:tRNA uridine 5-carbamoylmethylation protein Kti12
MKENYYVLFRGPLGAGKTTISKELARVLNAEYVPFKINIDKETLNRLDKEGKPIPIKYYIDEFKKLVPIVKNLLNNKKIVIIDGAYYYKKLLEFIFKNLNHKNFIFDLKVPLDTCISRDKERKISYGKDAAKAVYKQVSSFDYGIPIDVTKSLDETIKEIMSHLKSN